MRPTSPTPKMTYIRDLYAAEDSLLSEIDARLVAQHMQIHIGAEEGKLLQLLIRMNQVKTIVEIGTLGGYSALWMARALPDDGRLYTIENHAAHMDLAREMIGKSTEADKITFCFGEAQDELAKLTSIAPFDMVFIDADKLHYDYYLTWSEAYIKQGGLIVLDNTLLFDSVYLDRPSAGIRQTTWEVMRQVNKRLADPTLFESVLLPTKEGLTIAIRR